MRTLFTVAALCLLVPSARARALPDVDAEAIGAEVDARIASMEADARAAAAEEGWAQAVERLSAESEADAEQAYALLDLALVVAVYGGSERIPLLILEQVLPVARSDQLTSAVACHALLLAGGATEETLRTSAERLAWEGDQGEDLEARLGRFAILVTALEHACPDSAALGMCLTEAGLALYEVNRCQDALSLIDRALGPVAATMPDSTQHAAVLNLAGALLSELGRLDEAAERLRRSLEVHDKVGSPPEERARAENNLGLVLMGAGDLAGALEHVTAALRAWEAADPDSLDTASALTNIGLIRERLGEPSAALEMHERSLAIRRAQAPDSLLVVQSLTNLANATKATGRWSDARPIYEEALRAAEAITPDGIDLARVRVNLGGLLRDLGGLNEAEALYTSARATYAALMPESLDMSGILDHIAALESDRGRVDESLALHREALALYERIAPDSPERAACLTNVGDALRQKGDPAAALEHHLRALALHEQSGVEDMTTSIILLNTAAAHLDRGDLDAAGDAYSRALAIAERLAPGTPRAVQGLAGLAKIEAQRGRLDASAEMLVEVIAAIEPTAPQSPEVADALNDLGNVHLARGDLVRAASYYARAADILAAQSSESLAYAGQLHNLATVAFMRGDLGAARPVYEEALTIRERLAPGSLVVSETLTNLGMLAEASRDKAGARAFYERALAIDERLAPGSLDHADTLIHVGECLVDDGDLTAAEPYFAQAVEITRAQAPRSLRAARTYRQYTAFLIDRGDIDGARALVEEALAISGEIAPTAPTHATLLNMRGVLAEYAGDLERARADYAAAMHVIENARPNASLEERERGLFLDTYAFIYVNLIRVQRTLGDAEGAANTAESLRARAFLDALGERPLPAGAPPDIAKAQAELDAERDLLLRALWSGDAARSAQATARLADLEQRQARLIAQAREHAAAIAALAYPQPLPVREIAARLDPGTVVLTYVLGDAESFVSVYGKDTPIRVEELDLTADEAAEALREFAADVRTDSNAGGLLDSLGATLFGPVLADIRAAERVTLLPDGPMWLIPLHALSVDGVPLGALKPVTYSLSGTLLVTGSGDGGERGGEALVVGDPYFRDPEDDDPGEDGARYAYVPVSGARARGGRLPFTGVEADLIAGSLGGEPLVGAFATEERVRERLRSARIVHLATHGYASASRPLDSAVFLARPRPGSDEDGYLTAREVLSLDLSACELAALSACETGGGEVIGGEGVMGLTRAFLYAGADAVLCTQWQVADDATAALMFRFYEHWSGGLTKAAALAAAQTEIRTGRAVTGEPLALPEHLGPWREAWGRPYYWAPFVLVGEGE